MSYREIKASRGEIILVRDAAKLYDEAAIKHYGELAFTNFGGN